MDNERLTEVQPNYALIPGVDRVLEEPQVQALSKRCGIGVLTDLIREAIDRLRRAMREGEIVGDSKEALIALVVADVQGVLADQLAPSLRRVVNATGVILHTNLGRAPLPDVAVEQIADIAGYYSNLELDLETGQRGSRTTLVESLLCELTGAEAAAIVNNNAAAVLLMLNTLAEGKEAVVSRGQLVEIGGSFRIPDIMGRSGATMVEVGTTNRTHLKDYEAALTDTTGLMLVVHPSNYKVMGFTAEVMLEDLVTLGKSRGVPVAHDLGGGVLVDLREYGLPYEPLVSDSLTAGVDVVTFSGDKVLGGPQCGIIVGKKDAVEKIRKNPLMRALRCGKLTYAALEATLKMFLNPDALVKSHPTLRMLTESVSILKRRGRRLLALIGEVDDLQIDLVDSKAQTGSGALPLEEIESCAIAIACDGVQAFAERLRRYDLPVMGYVRDDRVFLDLRTMRNDELRVVADAVRWGGLG